MLCGADVHDPAVLPPEAASRASAAVRLLLAPPLSRFLLATPTGSFLTDQLAASMGVALDARCVKKRSPPRRIPTNTERCVAAVAPVVILTVHPARLMP